MNQEQINDCVEWDIRTWSKAINNWEKKVDWSQVNTVLELGGRYGGLSLWLALKGKKTICSDLKEVKQTAQPLHFRHEVQNLITYQDIDATEIPYENHFDLIVFKSILGGVGYGDNKERQAKAVQQMHKALKPGGKLLFAENTVASGFHQFMRKRFVKWGAGWRYITRAEMKVFLRDFLPTEIESTGFLATFGRSEKQRNSLARVDEIFFNRWMPKNWKYICYGVAEKAKNEGAKKAK